MKTQISLIDARHLNETLGLGAHTDAEAVAAYGRFHAARERAHAAATGHLLPLDQATEVGL